MDPFTEKELIDCLKAISSTLNNIDSRIEELTMAVRELGIEEEEDGDFGEAVIEDEGEEEEEGK